MAWLAAALPVAQPTIFDDLPLRGFELPERSRRASVPGFPIGLLDSAECLGSAGPNRLLAVDECAATDGLMWVYEPLKRALQLAHDVSLCLDVFATKTGGRLGVYWCHGGQNQEFTVVQSTAARDGATYCSGAYGSGAHCVTRRDAALATRQRAAAAAAAAARSDAPPCTPDSSERAAECAAWAAVGECYFTPRYMREHCQSACAREGAAECRLDETAPQPASPQIETETPTDTPTEPAEEVEDASQPW